MRRNTELMDILNDLAQLIKASANLLLAMNGLPEPTDDVEISLVVDQMNALARQIRLIDRLG